MKLYMVRQTQPFENYEDTTIAIYDNIEQANELARKLNKEYGTTDICEFDENWDFIGFYDVAGCVESLHYYDVESIELNESFDKFL